MPNKLFAIALIPITLAVAGFAFAGESQPATVSVDTTNKTARGTLRGARDSSDSVQAIVCNVRSGEAYCFARQSDWTSGSCYTTDPGMVQAAGAIGPASYVTFTWNASGYCTWIMVENGSYNL